MKQAAGCCARRTRTVRPCSFDARNGASPARFIQEVGYDEEGILEKRL